VILTPGHTPGSASLHVPAVDALFVGDAMSTIAMDGSTGPMIVPFTADRDTARTSLARIRDIDATWLLPGHGAPWSGGVGEAVALAVARAEACDLWTGCGRSSGKPTRNQKLVDKSPSHGGLAPTTVGLARRGSQIDRDAAGVYIGGGAGGREVPSGVFVRAARRACVSLTEGRPLPMRQIPELEPSAIRATRQTIPPVFRDSPQYVHPGLTERLGSPVVVKVETVNPIRSFKGRGTWVAIEGLAGEGRIGPERPFVCVSAGNFGQGVAYAARTLGVPAVVFCSTRANRGKVARMRALGATVIESGDDFDAARGESERYAADHGAELLVDGDDPRISTGAATMAAEVTDAVDRGILPELSIATIPVGNGALINGVASWFRVTTPDCRIVGVQAERADAMTRSFRAGHPVDTATADTYADGIASRVAIPRAVALLPGRIDAMVTVSEDALRDAQATLTEELGITVEGAAAAAWAGLFAVERPPGAALLVITGSNA
jgi:threonine dehydratase